MERNSTHAEDTAVGLIITVDLRDENRDNFLGGLNELVEAL